MLMAEYGRRSGSSLKDPAHDSVYRVGVLCTKPGGTAGMIIQPVPAETAIGTGFLFWNPWPDEYLCRHPKANSV